MFGCCVFLSTWNHFCCYECVVLIVLCTFSSLLFDVVFFRSEGFFIYTREENDTSQSNFQYWQCHLQYEIVERRLVDIGEKKKFKLWKLFVRKLHSVIFDPDVCGVTVTFVFFCVKREDSYQINWKKLELEIGGFFKSSRGGNWNLFFQKYCIKCINWNKWCCTRLSCWKFIGRLWVPGKNKI